MKEEERMKGKKIVEPRKRVGGGDAGSAEPEALVVGILYCESPRTIMINSARSRPGKAARPERCCASRRHH